MAGIFNPTTCNADIYLGDTVIGEVSGNWSARSYTISIDSKQVAEVKRQTELPDIFLIKMNTASRFRQASIRHSFQ